MSRRCTPGGRNWLQVGSRPRPTGSCSTTARIAVGVDATGRCLAPAIRAVVAQEPVGRGRDPTCSQFLPPGVQRRDIVWVNEVLLAAAFEFRWIPAEQA